MWKFNILKEAISNKISTDLIIQLVDEFDGILLFTSGNGNFESHMNIVGLNPIIKIYPEHTEFGNQEIAQNNFKIINAIIEENRVNQFLPIMLGYFSFDFKSFIEEEGLYLNLDDERFPKSYFSLFEHYLIFDSKFDQIVQLKLSFPFEFSSINLDLSKKTIIPETNKQSFYLGTNMNKKQFCEKVEKVKAYIQQGDIYQVNLTREINGKTSYSFVEIAKKLYYSNSIEFGVIAKINEKYLISTSPERFFKIENNKILTSPIKGTINKTKNKNTNKNQINNLINSQKELSELAMIVDLLRNDIGKICTFNSVNVKGFPILKELENVYHLVADIEGELSTNSIEEIIKGMFPGGSISGCPKIRACQIIEELEQKGRGPYTGSFGYFSLNGKMDFNILIRTLFYHKYSVWFNVGGGITLKSNPLKEYEETIHKASSIWEAINMEYIHEERYCME